MSGIFVCILLIILGWGNSFAAQQAPYGAGIAPEVGFSFPLDNSYFPYPTEGLATVSGKASYQQAKDSQYDVVLVLDTSGSTLWPCGIDLDNDGIKGELVDIGFSRLSFFGKKPVKLMNTDPDDSILAAEVLAARELLRLLNPDTTQISLVTFNGDLAADGRSSVPGTPDAFLEYPLTNDYGKVDEILTDIYNDREPYGGTNMGEGVEMAVGALTNGKKEAHKVIIFLTDGVPSFPFGSANVTEPGDKEYALASARKAQSKGIRINTFAIGGEALSDPATVQGMADTTGGLYTPVKRPDEIITRLAETKFFHLETVEVKNVTLAKAAQRILLSPDGTFMATVPVALGFNIIQATAKATDGSLGNSTLHLYYVPTKEPPKLGLDLAKDRLSDLKLALERQKSHTLELDIARWLEGRAKREEIKELYIRAGANRKGNKELFINLYQEKLKLILKPQK